MKKYLLLTLILLFAIPKVYSQQELGFYYTWGVTEGDKRYVFANLANVRSSEGSSADIIDKLKCGQEITILKDTEIEETIDGLQGRWIKVAYQKDNANKEGYLWQGVLSYTQLRRGEIKFVFGLDKMGKEGTHAQVKAVKGTEILSSIPYTVNSTSTAGGRIIDKTGLKGVDYVLEIMFGGAACGVSTYYDYFAWTGNKLVHMTQTYSVGDGDVYSYTEELQFPVLTPDGDLLMKMVQEGVSKKGAKNMDWLYKVELYRWTGVKLMKLNQDWKTGARQ